MGDQDKLLDEEALYAQALAELKAGNPRPGLWAKAFTESAGDESKSQALYIKLRVQLENERKQQEREAARAEAIESEQRKDADFFAVIEQLRLNGYEAKKSGNGWTIREPLGGRVKLSSDQALLAYAEGRVPVRPPRSVTPQKFESMSHTDAGLEAGSTLASAPTDEPAPSHPSQSHEGPSGVGGWLFLLVLGMLLLGPLLGVGRINADIMSAENQYPALKSIAKWSNLKTATWWTFLAIVAISVYGGWGLARGRDWSVVKRAKVVLWVAGPVGALIMDVIVPMATLGESNAGHAEFVGGLLASIIAAGIWTAYLSKSKRVHNTYGHPK